MAELIALGHTLDWNSHRVLLLRDIDTPEISTDKIDVSTSLDLFKKYKAGAREAGECPVVGCFDPDDTNGQVAMFEDGKAGTERPYVITAPDSLFTFSGNGFLTKVKIGGFTWNDKVGFTASICPTDEPELGITVTTGLTTPFFALSGSGDLVPAAAGDKYAYNYAVDNEISSVTVTPTATGSQVIKVNGNTVVSGVASSAISLAAGAVTDITIEVSYPGKASVSYIIHVARAGA